MYEIADTIFSFPLFLHKFNGKLQCGWISGWLLQKKNAFHHLL